jgi:hypothetical protein
MKFSDLLIQAIRRSEIPPRFEPGAEEALAKPVTELLQAWLEVHAPEKLQTDFECGQKAVLEQLLAELQGARDVPGE